MTDKPPADLHEAFVDRLFAKDATRATIADPALSEASAAMQAARLACERAAEVTTKVRGNKMQSPLSNERQARKSGFDLLERATRKMQSAREGLAREIAAIEKLTAAPPPPSGTLGMLTLGNVQSVLRSMTAEERQAAISEAIRNGEDDVVAAALNGPPLLTGLSAAMREMHRATWARARHPEPVDRLGRLRKAVDVIDANAARAQSFVGGLTDHEAIAAATRTEEEATRAAAAPAA